MDGFAIEMAIWGADCLFSGSRQPGLLTYEKLLILMFVLVMLSAILIVPFNIV